MAHSIRVRFSRSRHPLGRYQLASRRSIGDYPIGFGRPPDATKFKKGHSLSRRRKDSRPEAMVDIFRRVISEKVDVQVNGTPVRMTLAEAVIRTNFERGLQRHAGALSAIMSFMERAGMLAATPGPLDGLKLVVPGRAKSEEEFEALTAALRRPDKLKDGDF